MKSRWIRIGDATSQWINVLLLDGNPNESISGRAYREHHWSQRYIDAVADIFGDYSHCERAYLADLSYSGQIMAQHARRK